MTTRLRFVALIAAVFSARSARGEGRPRYEPGDLDMPKAGVVEIDTQTGLAKAEGTRVVVPDYEIYWGLTPYAALVLDGAVAIEGRPHARFRFDHNASDNLWTAGKFLFFDTGQDVRFAVGAELGPKLPFARAAHGVGAEGVGLARLSMGPTHVTGSAGGFSDPRAQGVRPTAFEAGLDLDQDLDDHDTWSLLGEVGATYYRADQPQLHVSAGIQRGSRFVDWSIVGLAGLLAGGDRWALYLGVTPRFGLGGSPLFTG